MDAGHAAGRHLRGNWWELYQEPELNALEEKLNTSNQNIAQSFQNFMAARAQVKQARASYYPTVTVGPSYTRGRTSGTEGSQLAGINSNSNDFSLPFDVSWEPDVWGRIRNTVREYANAAQVSAADLANERLSQQANLAEYYFELRGQDALIDLYEKTVVAYQENLRLTQVRSRTGVDTEQSVAEAELSLKTAIASTTNLRIARAQYEHAIALLTGQAASSFSMPRRSLTTSVPVIPIGVPSQILQRRPDIAAAERSMAQANALIGVETAAYYPTFNIGGDLGLESSKIGSLFTWPSRFFSVGPSASETLSMEVFAEGYSISTKRSTKRMRPPIARRCSQHSSRPRTISPRNDFLGQQRREQQEAIVAAQRYYDLSNIRYKTGVDTYLNVFTAETSLLSNQQTGINLYVQQMTSSVQLIEAVGGGWDTSQLPSEKAVANGKGQWRRLDRGYSA
jgi:NodT family efflux transporter outer membrane factor (OMF) lipoprotein